MPNLFRQQNLERLNNPESLDDYIKVSSPGVWIVLVVICLLIAASVIWGIFGTLTETSPAALLVLDGEDIAFIPEDRAADLTGGAIIRAADTDGIVTSSAQAAVPVSQLGDLLAYLADPSAAAGSEAAETDSRTDTDIASDLGALELDEDAMDLADSENAAAAGGAAEGGSGSGSNPLGATSSSTVSTISEYLGDTAYVVPVSVSIDLPNGLYNATVTLRTYAPFDLLTGGASS